MRPFFLLLLFLTACTRCRAPQEPIPCSFIEERDGPLLTDEELLTFWDQFHDEELSYLVQTALSCNRDFKIAEEKVLELRATYLIALSTLLPQVDALFTASRTRNSLTLNDSQFLGGTFTNLYQLGLIASWEIDLLGKRRDQAKAALFDVAAQRAEEYAFQVLLTSQVTTIYLLICSLYEQIDLAKKFIKLDTEFLEIAKARFQGGIVSETDVKKAEGLVEARHANLHYFEGQLKSAIYSLVPIVGLPPEEIYGLLDHDHKIPLALGKIPPILPLELLCRRPDIKEAEYQLSAAGARVIAARKELLPTVSVTGFFTWQTGFFSKLLQSQSKFWNITGAVTNPVYHGGGLIANINVMTSRQRQASYNYEQKILIALSDVEAALGLYFEEEKRLEAFQREVKSQAEALELSWVRYKAGLVNFTEIIVNERDLHDASALAVESKRALMTYLVTIYKSFGGGWDCCSLP